MVQKSGFTGGIFDFSFTSFVTARIIRVLYVLFILGSAIGAIIVFAKSGRSMGGDMRSDLLRLLASLLIFFLCVLGARIFCEMLIVVFRIAEHTGSIAAKLDASNVGLKSIGSRPADSAQAEPLRPSDAQDTARLPQAERKCSCGATISKNAKFCTECGNEV